MAGPDKAILEAVHSFPGPYTLKAIGPHTQEFVDAIRAAAESVHEGEDRAGFAARASSRGAHISVTVTVWVESSDGVDALYRAVQGVAGLRMLL